MGEGGIIIVHVFLLVLQFARTRFGLYSLAEWFTDPEWWSLSIHKQILLPAEKPKRYTTNWVKLTSQINTAEGRSTALWLLVCPEEEKRPSEALDTLGQFEVSPLCACKLTTMKGWVEAGGVASSVNQWKLRSFAKLPLSSVAERCFVPIQTMGADWLFPSQSLLVLQPLLLPPSSPLAHFSPLSDTFRRSVYSYPLTFNTCFFFPLFSHCVKNLLN